MKRCLKYYLLPLFLLLWLAPDDAFAQKHNESLRIEDGMVIVRFDKNDAADLNKLLKYFGVNADSLWNYENLGPLTKDGWKLYHLDKNIAEIAKPVDNGSNLDWGKQPIYVNPIVQIAGTPGFPLPVAYGTNNFKAAPSVFENKKDETVFLLRGYSTAKMVILSGNFNNWNTGQNKMLHTDSGWVAILKLIPGKYLYKFIVDGEWIHDANNTKREDDGVNDYNSVYFHYNYTFNLPGFADAKKVTLTGSFNDWNEKELQMQRTATGWQLPLYLKEGTHAYKFIVDKEWILDPTNKITRPDGSGNFNSFMGIGDTFVFKLNGYINANNVILSGNFNAWNTAELTMIKTKTGWQLPYYLAPGNYEYKFIVDGKWITDPSNPLKVGGGEESNSVLAFKPNHKFVLNKYPDAKEVYLSGSFNNWEEPGYKMVKKDGIWVIPVFLAAGKYTYKFVVDGKWILDPDNPLYDENEFGTGNSVLWIEPERTMYEN